MTPATSQDAGRDATDALAQERDVTSGKRRQRVRRWGGSERTHARSHTDSQGRSRRRPAADASRGREHSRFAPRRVSSSGRVLEGGSGSATSENKAPASCSRCGGDSDLANGRRSKMAAAAARKNVFLARPAGVPASRLRAFLPREIFSRRKKSVLGAAFLQPERSIGVT
ncbi:hypothetical protein MTO96_020792 [Rhipicephalus appendiculatus]